MIRLFKKYFIPHQGNFHQPHILRRQAVLVILISVFLLEGLFLIQLFIIFPLTGLFSSILPQALIDLTNADRQQASIRALMPNPLLEQAAQLKAQDMALKGYFAHTSPEGVSPWFWLDRVGYDYQAAGENLAVNFSDSAEIDEAWMNSSGHRANILNNDFTQIGIAVAQGLYKGRQAFFVVQYFGTPQIEIAVKNEPINSPVVKPVQKTPSKTAEQAVGQNNQPATTTPAQEMSVVKKAEPAVAAAVLNQASAESVSVNKTSWPAKIFVMPKTAISFVYFLIAGLMALVLILKVFVKIKIQYPKLILNGVLVLFVIISIFYMNYLIVAPGNVF